MDRLLKMAFRTTIKERRGFDFEDFVDELFLLKYGADKYIPIRRVRDGGNDGTIKPEKKVLACYAPEKYDKKEFEKKVNGTKQKQGDFSKYLETWQPIYSNWEMMVNHEVSPDQLILIENLEGNTSIKGLSQIISIIENDLPQSKIRKLAFFLGISDYVKKDYIKEVLDDLLSSPTRESENIIYESPLYIKDKIKINYSENDIAGALTEFDLIYEDFPIIEGIFKGYNDDENKSIKWRIITDFNKLNGNFKTKLDNLTGLYTREYGNIDDDEYNRYVRTILLYIFELCFIGKKTNEEL